MNVLQRAQDAAKQVLAADPALTLPEHAALAAQVDRLYEANAGTIN